MQERTTRNIIKTSDSELTPFGKSINSKIGSDSPVKYLDRNPRSSSSTRDQWNTNSLNPMMSILSFSNHGASNKKKSWTGEDSLTQESPLPFNAVSAPSKKSKAHSTVFTLCPITTSCAPWDSRNGSDATTPTETTEQLCTIEALRMDWPTWRTKTIIRVSENGTRLHMPALITSWDSWWNSHMPRRLKTSGQEMSATAKSECSQRSTTHPPIPKESHTPIDLF